jgi:hypothetical protein
VLSLAIWTLLFATVLLLLGALLGSRRGSCTLKWALLPGVLVVVASRVLACSLSRAPLRSVNLPWRPGPLVVHDKPAIPVLGPVLLALVPLFIAMTVVVMTRSHLAPDLACHAALPPVEPHAQAVGALVGTSAEVLCAVDDLAVSEPAHRGASLAFLYLAFSVLVCTAPTLAEWKVMAATFGSFILVGAGCNYLGIRAGFLSRGWFLDRAFGQAGHEALGLLIATGVLSLAAVAAAAVGTALLRAVLVPRSKADEKKKG